MPLEPPSPRRSLDLRSPQAGWGVEVLSCSLLSGPTSTQGGRSGVSQTYLSQGCQMVRTPPPQQAGVGLPTSQERLVLLPISRWEPFCAHFFSPACAGTTTPDPSAADSRGPGVGPCLGPRAHRRLPLGVGNQVSLLWS